MNIKKKLLNPFVLVGQGFVAGAIMFYSWRPGPRRRSRRRRAFSRCGAADRRDLTQPLELGFGLFIAGLMVRFSFCGHELMALPQGALFLAGARRACSLPIFTSKKRAGSRGWGQMLPPYDSVCDAG
jgi:hypothetical protein